MVDLILKQSPNGEDSSGPRVQETGMAEGGGAGRPRHCVLPLVGEEELV
jgi:hypothetical protein